MGVPCANVPYHHAYHYGKREADADAGVVVAAGYGLPYAGIGYGYNPVHAVVNGVHSSHYGVCTNVSGLAVPCGRKKREADADAGVVVAAGYGGYGLPYAGHLGYAGVGYGIPNPVHAVAATAAGPVHSSLVGLCTNYLGAAVPCRRKREAEADADADAAVVVSGLPYAGLGYAGLGSHGVVAAAPAVVAAAPAVVAAAPVVAPVATVTQAV